MLLYDREVRNSAERESMNSVEEVTMQEENDHEHIEDRVYHPPNFWHSYPRRIPVWVCRTTGMQVAENGRHYESTTADIILHRIRHFNRSK